MKKAAAILVLLAVLWAVPGFRGNVAAGALPALERLGTPGEYAAKPLRNVMARIRANAVLRAMASEYNRGVPIPEEKDFPNWIRQRFPNDRHIDPWGNPYWFERTRHTLTVGSSGADGRRGTADDLTDSIPF